MARANYVKKARKAVPSAGIEVGDSYYWWKFRFGGKHYSKTPPRRSQLTQSGFLSQVYDLQDRIGDAEPSAELGDLRDEVVDELNNLMDECQSSLDNMPENLQESSASGEMLRERIEGLENAVAEFEALDFSDPDIEEVEREEDESEEDFEKREEENREEQEREHWQGLLDEMQAIEIPC